MKRYLLRYVIFWLPAAVLAVVFQNDSFPSVVLQWFFAFFFLMGWAVNSGMAAAKHPRGTLMFLLGYTGIATLSLVATYSASYHGTMQLFFRQYFSLLTFRPMDIFITHILRYNIAHEAYVTGFLVIACLVGWLVGRLVYGLQKRPHYRGI